MTPLLWCTLAVAALVSGAVADIVLAVAIALAALLAGLAQYASNDWQIAATVFCVAALVTTLMAIRFRQRRPVQSVMDDDLGQRVTLLHVNPDGSLRVHYRGCDWDAHWQTGAPVPLPESGSILTICGKQANCLHVKI